MEEKNLFYRMRDRWKGFFLIENAEITKYNNKEKDCLIILDKKKRREAYV